MFVDGLHEQALDFRQGEGFFRKSIKLGFAQNLCKRSHTLDGSSMGDKPVRPFPAVAFFVVGGTVFKLLLFVPKLGELALIGGNLGFQFGNGFLFGHRTWPPFDGIDGIKKTAYIFGRRSG